MKDIPREMRVVAARQPGGPESLVVETREVPAPAPDQVLVRVAAAGVNRADVLQRKGGYPPPRGAPDFPGLEVAGTVVAAGHDVREFTVGERVCALLEGGGYAEYCVVAAGQVLPVPGHLDFVAAATLPEAYFTVWSNVFVDGRLAPGERLLVHGGSSGIGVAAIQLAVARGSIAYATAGTAAKCHFCESLGASRAVDYRSEDFVAVLREVSGAHGVDVVLDMVGGSYAQRNVELLAPGGRLVMIAAQGGVNATVNLLQVMLKRLVITGSTLRPQSAAFKRRLRDELLQQVWPRIADGTLRPVVDRVFPLEAAGEAHARMESSAHIGKIVLAVAGS